MKRRIVVAALTAAFTVAQPALSEPLALRVSCGLPHDAGPARNIVQGSFEGRRATRVTLGPDDAGRCQADIRRGNHNRAELRSADLPLGRPIRIEFDLFIPKDFAVSGGVFIGQLHQRRAKPMILLRASPRGYDVAAGSGLRALGARITRRRLLFDRGAFGHWRRIAIEARFARDESGFIRVVADGVPGFEAVGPTVETAPYFKIGLYGRRDRIEAPLAVYFTDPTIALE